MIGADPRAGSGLEPQLEGLGPKDRGDTLFSDEPGAPVKELQEGGCDVSTTARREQ